MDPVCLSIHPALDAYSGSKAVDFEDCECCPVDPSNLSFEEIEVSHTSGDTRDPRHEHKDAALKGHTRAPLVPSVSADRGAKAHPP